MVKERAAMVRGRVLRVSTRVDILREAIAVCMGEVCEAGMEERRGEREGGRETK